MSMHIQNIGFTKTYVKENNKTKQGEIKWVGDYDGHNANINMNINNDGHNEFVSMKLNNEDLKNILGIQPIDIPLEQRLKKDFYEPTSLELIALKKMATKKHKRKRQKMKKSRKHKK